MLDFLSLGRLWLRVPEASGFEDKAIFVFSNYFWVRV